MKENPLIWALKSGVLSESRKYVPTFSRVISSVLKPKRNEKILVLTDHGENGNQVAPIIGYGYFIAARKMGLGAEVQIQNKKSGTETAEEHVVKSLATLDEGNIIIVSKSNKIGLMKQLGRSFRRYARGNDHKFISSIGLGSLENRLLPKIIQSMDIDYPELQQRQKMIKGTLDKAKEVRVTTPAGSDFFLDIRKRKAISNDGSFHKKSSGGNIPCGEVYIANNKRIGDGKIVIDGSSRNQYGTTVIKRPIRIDIKDGEITSIGGGQEASLLHKTIKDAINRAKFPWGITLVGELGIGCNFNASIIGSMIVDEKANNTAHIAFGSNHWFGGKIKAISHLDQVMRNPSIYVDGKPFNKILKQQCR